MGLVGAIAPPTVTVSTCVIVAGPVATSGAAAELGAEGDSNEELPALVPELPGKAIVIVCVCASPGTPVGSSGPDDDIDAEDELVEAGPSLLAPGTVTVMIFPATVTVSICGLRDPKTGNPGAVIDARGVTCP